MINFELVDFRRAIMHEVHRKTNLSEASITASNDLIPLDEGVIDTIKKRLNTSFGRRTRCFEMGIADISENSFYDICHNLNDCDDQNFIDKSILLASNLAESQNKKPIPGGFFILIEGRSREISKPVYIVIKADGQEALAKNDTTGHIAVLKNIFLSPAQKLYKIGAMIERCDIDSSKTYPNDRFECYLFDEQLNTKDVMPATYFFDKFLGFSENGNSKIESSRYYTETVAFINANIGSFDERDDIITALKSEFLSNEPSFDPNDFGRRYFSSSGLMDSYASNILTQHPRSFIKDIALLENSFKSSKMVFENKIKITGPTSDFFDNIKILNRNDIVDVVQNLEDGYTVLLIKGVPRRNV